MDRTRSRPAMRVAATGAVVLGLAAGSYGVASAATGSGSGSSAGTGSGSSATLGTHAAPSASGPARGAPQGWGQQRSDETLLTGDTAAQVRAAAVAKVGSGATVSRVETDADGHAAYEVHMVKADGTLVTVYVDTSFDVVSVETGMPAPPQRTA